MKQSDLKLDYIEFHASDMGAVQAFYEQVFDWKFTSYGPDYLAFDDGQCDGGFRRGDGQARSGQGAPLVVFYAKDLEGTRDKVIAAGGTIHVDIFDFPGGRRFHFLDPHGNELGVWSDG